MPPAASDPVDSVDPLPDEPNREIGAAYLRGETASEVIGLRQAIGVPPALSGSCLMSRRGEEEATLGGSKTKAKQHVRRT